MRLLRLKKSRNDVLNGNYKKYTMKKSILFLTAVLTFDFQLLTFNCTAQTLKRQCIASTGNCILENGTTVQQTIGQPYGTTSYYSNKTRYNPGFQQPVFSVETIKSTINATVFPNPASNQITIETNLTLENVIIQIIELSGKLVLNEKTNEFKSYTINCADWSNGVYLITLSDSKNNLYSSKLIISK